MPNELNIALGQTGLTTVTARLVTGTGFVGDAIACPELPSGSGRYSGDVPGGTAAGTYDVLFLSGSATVGSGVLHWDGAAEINARTLNTRVGNIPTNPLLTNDGRITTITNDLDSLEIAAASILQDTSIDIPAAISAIPSAPASSDIYTYFTADTRANAFKADLSGITADIDSIESAIASVLEDTSLTLPGLIDAVPTASENAAAIRTELSPELARLDEPVSSRSNFNPDSDRVDIRAVQGVAVLDIDDFKADVSNLEAELETVGDAVGRIDVYTTKRSDIEGLTTGVSTDLAAPVDESTPGYIRTSNDSVNVDILQVSDTVRRMQPSV